MTRPGDPTRDVDWYRRAGSVLLAVAAWTAYIWLVRAYNLARDFAADPAPVVHAALTVVSLLTAVAVAVIGVGLLRRSRR